MCWVELQRFLGLICCEVVMLDISKIMRYKENNKWGLQYKDSKDFITEPIYDDIRKIKGTNNYLKIKRNNKWGVITIEGEEIVKVSYDDITFYDGKNFTVFIGKNQTFVKNPHFIQEPKIIVDIGYWEPQWVGIISDTYNPPVDNKKGEFDRENTWDYNIS